MRELTNAMIRAAAQAQSGVAGPRQGVITAYDPNAYAVKVQIQPTGEETGWIPLPTSWVGNGWGLAAGPMIGAVIGVDFDSGLMGAGMATGQYYNDVDRCPGPPSGEFWLVHQSGSLLKFTNDGNVLVSSTGTITYNAAAHHFTGGDVTMDENLIVKKDILDNDSAYGNVNLIRTTYNGHTHHENGEGSNTDTPNQQLA